MTREPALTPVSYAHLATLTDRHGVFEHALHAAPRKDGGFCVDDVARALIVVVRDPEQDPPLTAFTHLYLGFLESAIAEDGSVHNRMSPFGAWTDEPSLGDWWGRLLWALGVTANRSLDPSVPDRALDAFHLAATRRSPHLRAMAFAALGAAAVLQLHPNDAVARALLETAMATISAADDRSWRWLEPRMSYANASIAEALISGGDALGRPELVERGLGLLRFLLELEMMPGHLSVTGSAGRGPSDSGPQFDQQPIEVAALADACARAFDLTGDPGWLDGVRLASDWFMGVNDSGIVMYDIDRGAGFDGLEAAGRNENQGAESTLAALSTHQQVRRLARYYSPASVS